MASQVFSGYRPSSAVSSSRRSRRPEITSALAVARCVAAERTRSPSGTSDLRTRKRQSPQYTPLYSVHHAHVHHKCPRRRLNLPRPTTATGARTPASTATSSKRLREPSSNDARESHARCLGCPSVTLLHLFSRLVGTADARG